MARKYQTYIREEKAVEFTIEISSLERYMDVWLTLCNNARDYPDRLLKVSNLSGTDKIFILSPFKRKDEVKEWLSQFCDDIREDTEYKMAVFVDITCDYSDFDKDYIDADYIFGELD